jgi:hypothetical protein
VSGAGGKDPEKLLSEALRAQVTRAPADTSPVGYGLFSGSDIPAALQRPAESATAATPPHQYVEQPRQIPATLILLLALLLGLASGAVIGLLTLL